MTDTETVDQLIARAAAGGADAPAAMSAFYARLNGTVFGWVRQYVRDPHTAEDLAQEVWLKVAQKVGTYRPGTNLMAWLMTITRNTAIDHLRAVQRRPTEVLHADHTQLDRPRPGLTPHQHAERRQLAEAVAAHMGKLKPDQRRCLRLRFFDGCTPADTAHIMGKTEGAVRTLTLRSLRRLAQVLPEGDSSAALVEELLTIAVGRGNVVGVRVETRERAQHVSTL
ncbi:RNA polymerase sigma factor [Streptomyces sp. SP18BB07]|uniref:RNA polymerase sigma factor n=1 Tax=Streptomyces sp. SP18BB07 TaxID=3002522 RepID=UPI002E79E896|nr:sigma-70 family RNA polymerase sigma factor [Streptomyces sp. SP18BB07]MEE1764444.1 sigma-70 family RNA polymerase sigma factor [Streptomyces sp. SP18BB07]